MSDRDLGEFLTDRDRILRAAWMLPNDGPLSDSQRTQALDNFRAYLQRHSLTYVQVARQLGSPRTSTIRELVDERVYRKNADDHIRTLNHWIEQHARQQAVRLDDAFVDDTTVAKQILNVARLVCGNHTMGLVVGPTGIGKSRCAQALSETQVGSILITVMSGVDHPKGLTTRLADRLGVRLVAKVQRDITHLTQLERVIERLRDSNRLLIIDEAHKLRNQAIELLREIHDMTGVPILFLATRDLWERIERNADPDHGQLYSRIGITRPLTQGYDVQAGGKRLFTVDQIKRLYNQIPIRLATDAARYLEDVANDLGRGSLRLCKELLINAARRARKRQSLGDEETVTVTADDLEYTETRLRQDSGSQEMAKARRVRAASA